MAITSRTVLVTGCSSGIGHTVAHGLRKRGHRVVASARKVEDVERLREEGLEAVRIDLDDSRSIAEGLEMALAITGGTLYALFNNGAYGQPGAVEDLSREALRAQFETNLFGWVELTNRIIPLMREAGEGRIIQNSSVLGLVAMAYRGAYNASKYALEGITDTLRLELRGSGIHVSLIEPGPVESRFRANAYRAWQRWIDAERSFHRESYRAMEARLKKPGPAAPFTVPPEAVLKRVIHALESPRPQVRYYVTFPTYLFATLRRILPYTWLDAMLARSGGDGRR
ncbi:MAG TPA: SDR family oxidoreductase [Thiotrichales bacterium]|nr:SDR family oxidoreductase [Thiotrichales bacterium]